MKELEIAFSTCPNDTFIFYALVSGKFKDCPFTFNAHLADIEQLNSLASKKKFHITKISFNALGKVQEKYALLDSGSALGEKCGPLLISGDYNSIKELNNKVIGLPGELTTANFLFDLATNIKCEKKFLRFDEIIPSLLSKKIDAGVIIHESRFTYKQFNINCLIDLGEWWETLTSKPLPLGGIAVSKSLTENEIKILDKYLKLSIQYAYDNLSEVKSYIKKYAQEIDDSVIESHIELYVNKFTYSLGEEGIQALNFFMNKGVEKGIFQNNILKICGINGCYPLGKK